MNEKQALRHQLGEKQAVIETYREEHDRQAERIVELERENIKQRDRADALWEAIGNVRERYPEDVFVPGSGSPDSEAALWARRVCDQVEAEAEKVRREWEEAMA